MKTAVPAVLIAALTLAFLWGGGWGALGMGMALSTGGIGAWLLWLAVRVSSRSIERGSSPEIGTAIVVLAWLVKLPLFLLAGIVAKRLGEGALQAYAAGVVLVYFALVGWAVRSTAQP